MSLAGWKITGFVILAIFIAIIILAVLCALALTTYSGCCNIQATTGNNVKKRESVFTMVGSVYWGWFIAPVSILMFVGLIVGSFFGYRKLKHKVKNILATSKGYTKLNENDELELHDLSDDES